MKRKYIILIGLNAQNAQLGKQLLAACKAKLDPQAEARWIDATGAGICVFTDWPALSIDQELSKLCRQQSAGQLRNLAVLELGEDCSAGADSKLQAWIDSHRACSGFPPS